MLSERSRNTLVGMTLVVALAVLMYGILLLGKLRGVGTGMYAITVLTPNANGVMGGAKVDVNGVPAGDVAYVELATAPASALPPSTELATGPATASATRMIVRVHLNVDDSMNIPTSARVVLGKQTIGTAYVSILVNDTSGPKVPHDGSGVLFAEPAETGLIPRDVLEDVRALKADLSTLARQLSTVAGDLHVLLAYNTPEDVDKANPNDPNRPRSNVSTVIVRLDQTIKSLQALLTDPQLQNQVREAVQNIADASRDLKSTLETINATAKGADRAMASFGAAATQVGGAADKFGGAATQATIMLQSTQTQIATVAQHLADTLGQIDKTMQAIREGNGTTGKLINDPRLYDGLVDLSKSLRATVDDLDFLVKKWKDEGVDMRLK